MKKNKGFTLAELIASIAILAVILLMVTLTYSKIHKNVLEAQYQNVKEVIEQAGVRYSSKNGYFVFFVQELIDNNYLEPDDDNNIYDPRNNKPLNCHIVQISEDKHGNLKGTMLEEDHTVNGVCKMDDLEAYPGLLKLHATIEDTLIQYSAQSKNDSVETDEYGFPMIYDGWTRHQLDIEALLNGINEKENIDGYYIIWNKDPNRRIEDPQTTIRTNEPDIFNSSYYADLYLPSNSHYQSSIRYKRDNEKPVIFHDKTKVSSATSNDKWTRNKTIIIYATDKDGVGLDRIYVGPRSCNEFITNDIDKSMGQPAMPGMIQTYIYNENVGENGVNLNVCAIDKLGNLADGGQVFVSKIDKEPPSCTLSATGFQGNGEWFKKNTTSAAAGASDVTVSITPSDSGAGVNKYFVSANQTGAPVFPTNSSSSLVVSTDTGKNGKEYYGYVIDKAGNIGSCVRTIYRDATNPTLTLRVFNSVASYKNYDYDTDPQNKFLLDVTNPTTSSYTLSWNNTGHRVIVIPTDSGSGFSEKDVSTEKNLRYQYNDSGNITDVEPLSHNGYYDVVSGQKLIRDFGFSAEGKRLQSFTLCDDAGNCTTSSIEDDIDKTPPRFDVYLYRYKGNYAGSPQECPSSSGTCYYPIETPVAHEILYNGDTISDTWNKEGTAVRTKFFDDASGLTYYVFYSNAGNNLNEYLEPTSMGTETTLNSVKSYGYVYRHMIGEGKRKYRIVARDAAGNESEAFVEMPIVKHISCSISIRKNTDVDGDGVIDNVKGNGNWYKGTDGTNVVKAAIMELDYFSPNTVTGVLITNTQQTGTITYKADNAANKRLKSTTSTSSSGRNYYGYIKDASGNTASCTFKLYYDKDAPTCNYDPNNNETVWTKGPYTGSVTCADSHSGCDPNYSGDTFTVNDEKTHTFNVLIKDKAGNQTTCSKSVNVLVDSTKPKIVQDAWLYREDKTYPDANIIGTATNANLSYTWNNTGHRFRYTATDSMSGLKKAEFYINKYGVYNSYTAYQDADGNEGVPYTTYNYNGEATKQVTNPLSKSAPGKRKQAVNFCDQANNCRSVYSISDIDVSAPKLSVAAYKYSGTRTDNTNQCSSTKCDYLHKGSVTLRVVNENGTIDWNKDGHMYIVTYSDNAIGTKWIQYKVNAAGNYSTVNALGSTQYMCSPTSSNGTCSKSTSNTIAAKSVSLGAASTDGGKRQIYFRGCDDLDNCRELTVDDWVDKVAPTCSITATGTTGSNGYYTSDEVNLSMTVNDGQSGVLSYTMTTDGSLTDISDTAKKNTYKISTNTTGTVTVYGYVKDRAGNVTKCSKQIKKDNVKPNCTISISSGTKGNKDGNVQWYKSDVTVKLTNITDTGAGISNYFINKTATATDASFPSEPSSTYTQSTTAGTTLYGHVKDKAGNIQNCSVKVYVDKTAPTIKHYAFVYNGSNDSSDYDLAHPDASVTNGNLAMGWNNTGHYFYYVYSDATSGVGTREIRINPSGQFSASGEPYPGLDSNGVPTIDPTFTYTYSPTVVGTEKSYGNTINGNGKRFQHIKICDVAGNCRAVLSRTAIERDAPTCSLEVSSGTKGSNNWYTTNVTVRFKSKADQTNKSGISNYFINKTSTATAASFPSSVDNDIDQTSETAGTTLYGHVIDGAGNIGNCNLTIKVDKTPPDITQKAFVYNGSADLADYDLNNPAGAKTNGSLSMGYNNTGHLFYYEYIDSMSGAKTRTIYLNDAGTFGSTYPGYNSTSGEITMDPYPSSNNPYTWSTPVKTQQTYKNTVTSDGNRLQALKICNDAGLCRIAKSFTRPDKVKPTCTIGVKTGTKGNGSWYVSNTVIAVTPSDNGFGIDTSRTLIKSSNGGAWTGTQTTEQTQDVAGRVFTGYVYDKVGNANTCQFTLNQDKTRPTCAPKVYYYSVGTEYITKPVTSPNWTTDSLYFNHNCTDSQSGLASVTFTNGTKENKKTTDLTGANRRIDVYTELGNYSGITGYGVKACDAAGNCTDGKICADCTSESQWNNHTLAMDKVPPTITATASDGNAVSGTHNKGVLFTLSCADNESGVNTHTITCNGSSCGYNNNGQKILSTDYGLVVGSNTVVQTCKDKAGQISTKTYNITLETGSSGTSCLPVFENCDEAGQNCSIRKSYFTAWSITCGQEQCPNCNGKAVVIGTVSGDYRSSNFGCDSESSGDIVEDGFRTSQAAQNFISNTIMAGPYGYPNGTHSAYVSMKQNQALHSGWSYYQVNCTSSHGGYGASEYWTFNGCSYTGKTGDHYRYTYENRGTELNPNYVVLKIKCTRFKTIGQFADDTESQEKMMCCAK